MKEIADAGEEELNSDRDKQKGEDPGHGIISEGPRIFRLLGSDIPVSDIKSGRVLDGFMIGKWVPVVRAFASANSWIDLLH